VRLEMMEGKKENVARYTKHFYIKLKFVYLQRSKGKVTPASETMLMLSLNNISIYCQSEHRLRTL